MEFVPRGSNLTLLFELPTAVVTNGWGVGGGLVKSNRFYMAMSELHCGLNVRCNLCVFGVLGSLPL